MKQTIIVIVLLLSALLPWSPALASEPTDVERVAVPAAEPAEPEQKTLDLPLTVPEGYAVKTLAVALTVTLVDTPANTLGLVDAVVVMDVARQLSQRGEAGLVVACVPAPDNPAVCGVTLMALSAGAPVAVPVGGRD